MKVFESTNMTYLNLFLWLFENSNEFEHKIAIQMATDSRDNLYLYCIFSLETFEFELQHCKCHRTLKKVSKISNLNETTCSMDAYHRGEGQKIVGFSYYRVKDKSKVKHKNCR